MLVSDITNSYPGLAARAQSYLFMSDPVATSCTRGHSLQFLAVPDASSDQKVGSTSQY